MYGDFASVHLKGVLDTKSQLSRFGDMGGMVEKLVIQFNIKVNLLDLWP